jgi:hypothetical protein
VNNCPRRTVLTLLLWRPAPLRIDGASTPSQGTAEGIPIELTSRFSLVLVRLEVNGRPATFVVDTASSHTILSTEFLQLQRIEVAGGANPRKGSGLVGNAAWIKVTMRAGDAVWRDHEFLAMEIFPMPPML